MPYFGEDIWGEGQEWWSHLLPGIKQLFFLSGQNILCPAFLQYPILKWESAGGFLTERAHNMS